jgi:hypothetical protein
MSDLSMTEVRAWPWPGEQQLPERARAALAAKRISGIDRAPGREQQNAVLIDGDEQTGVILRIVEEEADGGIEEFRELIEALHEAGLHVHAINQPGRSYSSELEYREPGQPARSKPLCPTSAVAVLSASELLEACASTGVALESVDDRLLGQAAKRLLAEPVLPAAVRALP